MEPPTRKSLRLLVLGFSLISSLSCLRAEQGTWNWPIVPEIQLPVDAAGKHASIGQDEFRQILARGKAPFPVISDSRYALIKYEYLSELLDWYREVSTVWGVTPEEMAKRGFMRSRTIRMLRCFAGRAIVRDYPDVEAGVAIGMLQVTLKKPWGLLKAGATTDFMLVGTDRGWFVVDPVGRFIRPFAPDSTLWRFNLTRF